MKIEKNKVVFISIIVIVILFIVAYTAMVLTDKEQATDNLQQPLVPALKEEKKNYTSKMDALNDLKEERRSNPPSIYSEKLLDSLGVFDPALEEKNRERMVDSIYRFGNIDYEEGGWREDHYMNELPQEEEDTVAATSVETITVIGDHTISHREFFRFEPLAIPSEKIQSRKDTLIAARVHGSQEVRVNDRLELILAEEAHIDGKTYPKNTLLYGFVSLKPNRLHIKITHIHNHAVALKAYDLQDSNEGVYVENSFRAQAGREVLDGVIQDINVAGLPQISGIKNLFRRNNSNLKVTVLDQYQLVLKPEL